MCFDLTAKLSDEILSAMENQNTKFVIDAKNGIVAESEDSKIIDNDRFYQLPVWNSGDGFVLRERFVSELHVPIVQEELQTVLHSGRGVFRNFKNAVRQYPEVERKWHLYKNHEMRIRINEWYNALREIWGLERLDQEPDDIEDLVLKDFVFREYDSERDRDSVLHFSNAANKDSNTDWPEPVKNAFAEMWKQQFNYGTVSTETGFVCFTPSDDFTGCITFASCPPEADKTVVLTSFMVLENFRGLGIGKELLSLSLTSLQKHGKQWVIIANTIIPDSMIPLLNRSGFKRIGSGFVADLVERKDIL